MTDDTAFWEFEVELQPGEQLRIPPEVASQVGSGRWRLTVEPASPAVRSHSGFLNSYAPSDEGLYDDCVGG